MWNSKEDEAERTDTVSRSLLVSRINFLTISLIIIGEFQSVFESHFEGSKQ